MRNKIEQYIKRWELQGYPDGIPDEAPTVLEMRGIAPSYRMICRAIMKNDVALTSLGFSREPCEAYMYLKRLELNERARRNKQ